MSFAVQNREEELKIVFDQLRANNMVGTDLSNNEMAKSHGI